jgi:iron complex outermembrane receptor protein
MRIMKALLLASTASLFFVSPANAQVAPAPSDTSAQRTQPAKEAPLIEDGDQNDIIVTANKRSESINDIPEAVTAFTAESRQVIGITSLSDFAKFTPGLSYDGSSDRVFLRGVGRTTNTAGSDPGVATYTDGIYDSSTASVANDDFFIERVEILRGPQGTLYGRNSIGGAINAISKRPTDQLSVEGRVTVGNYDLQSYEASVSGPLTGGIRARVAGQYGRQGDGYFHNLAGGPSEGGAGNSYYVEGQLDFDLGTNATLWVKGFTSGSNSRPRSANFVTPYDYGPFPTGAITPGSAFGYLLPGFTALGTQTANPGVTDVRNFSTDTPSRARLRDSFGGQAQLDVHLQPFDIRLLGGYREYKFDSVADLDSTSVLSYSYPLAAGAVCGFIPGCGPLTVRPSTAFKYLEDRSFGSAEVNFISNGTGPLKWIAGLYYYGEDLNQVTDFNSVDQLEIRAPANGPANPNGDFIYAATHLKTASYAGFGQIDWDVTSTIRLTGGLRYSRDEKRADESFRAVCLGCSAGLTPDQLGSFTPAIDLTSTIASMTNAPGVLSPTRIDPSTGRALRTLNASWGAFSGTAGIQWRPAKDSLLYVNYSRGYKSGGFNAGGLTAFPQTNPEYVDAYQGGLKQKVGSVQLNVAGYFYNYRGLQIPLSVPQPSGISFTNFFNLDRAKSYGAELEASWTPVKDLLFLVAYAYSDSKITSCCYVDSADPGATQPGAQPTATVIGANRFQSLNGEELPLLPRHKVSANANYTFRFSPGDLTLSASYAWRASQYSSVFNRFYSRVPASETVDARLLWTGTQDRYRVILFVQNVFNRVNYDSAVNPTGGNGATPYALGLDPQYTVNYGLGVAPPRTFGAQFQVKF